MEACCISSNPFTKTMEAVPMVKCNKAPVFAQKKHIQTTKKRHVHPLTVSCHRSTSSSSSSLGSNQDEVGPIVLNSDWRSFRARLIAKEHQHSGMLDLGASISEPSWAHRIHEPEKGCLLIATEKLDGVDVFERTVILVLSTGPVGPTGLILNRPSLMSIKEVPTCSLDASGAFSNRPLFSGGPFEDGFFLMSPKRGKSDDSVAKSGLFEELMKGLYYGTRESVGFAGDMVRRGLVQESEFRFFDGFCAWERGQLRDEIRAGKWTVAACSPNLVGLSSVGSIGLWEEVNELLSPQKVF